VGDERGEGNSRSPSRIIRQYNKDSITINIEDRYTKKKKKRERKGFGESGSSGNIEIKSLSFLLFWGGGMRK